MAVDRSRQVALFCQCIVASVALSNAVSEDRRELAASGAELLFREDWKTTPAELPITQAHVATRGLILGMHGPGSRGIKKSHHDQPADDPYYLWSGQCRMRWAFSLRPTPYFMDLSAEDARLRLRTRQSGDHALYLLIKLPGEWWYISDESIPTTTDWKEFELKLADLSWRRFNIITIAREEEEGPASLAKVEEIGLTDLQTGAGSKASSRVDWVEIWGRRVRRPPQPAAAVKSTPAEAELPAEVSSHEGLTYVQYGQRELKLDLYMPARGRGPFPGIVFIHGGGWYKGSRDSYTPMAQQLAARGYVTANIEYRLSGEAPFPAAIHDCKAAVRWMRANAPLYRVDAKRIGCVGGSAGGHLAGLLATSGHVTRLDGQAGNLDQSCAVQAAVVMAGAMDLTDPEILEAAGKDPRKRMVTFMGGSWETARQTYVDASPITHLSRKTPPFLMLDGEFDKPGERYVKFRHKLKQLGVRSEFHMIEGGPHPFWNRNPFFETSLGHLDEFFARTLGKVPANHEE